MSLHTFYVNLDFSTMFGTLWDNNESSKGPNCDNDISDWVFFFWKEFWI